MLDAWHYAARPLVGAVIGAAFLYTGQIGSAPRAHAFQAEVLESVVSVLPLWPNKPRGGQAAVPPGTAPEGTAVAILPGGYLVTALHVVDQAIDIEVRLPDGRQIPAELVAGDTATDLALLKTAADLPVLPDAPDPALGAPACLIGNQFGLDLSVTCGVISALHRSGTGFNAIEDFVQTDASANPGASGGPLVDAQGRLLGIVSAIFTKESDADIGVNFAASIALVRRVVEDLAAHGRVVWADAGLRVRDLEPAQRARLSGAMVVKVAPGGAAERAGLRPGDIVQRVGARAIRKASDVTSAQALARPGESLTLSLAPSLAGGADQAGAAREMRLDLPR